MGEKKNILIIEDEFHIAEGLRLNLSLQGFDVAIAENGRVGLEKWGKGEFDLIILDLMMPQLDGVSVLKKVRETNERVPVLILSAKDGIKDRVSCLRKGVDDYMTKPFNLDEFLLRVKRLLQRANWSVEKNNEIGDKFKFGQNTVNLETGKANTTNGNIMLTLQEIKLLKLFFQNIGKPLSRDNLLKNGWGYCSETTTRTVDNFIVRFRKYFENDPKKPIFFKSLRSVGYVFDKEEV